MWTRLMIVWEEFCGGWSILCNVDTGGQLDNEANIQALNLYDHHDHYKIREVSKKIVCGPAPSPLRPRRQDFKSEFKYWGGCHRSEHRFYT